MGRRRDCCRSIFFFFLTVCGKTKRPTPSMKTTTSFLLPPSTRLTFSVRIGVSWVGSFFFFWWPPLSSGKEKGKNNCQRPFFSCPFHSKACNISEYDLVILTEWLKQVNDFHGFKTARAFLLLSTRHFSSLNSTKLFAWRSRTFISFPFEFCSRLNRVDVEASGFANQLIYTTFTPDLTYNTFTHTQTAELRRNIEWRTNE